MQNIIERYRNNELVTRDNSTFEIEVVNLNPATDQVDSFDGTVTIDGNTQPMSWNTNGSALGAVQIPTGNPAQPFSYQQARQFDLLVRKPIQEYTV